MLAVLVACQGSGSRPIIKIGLSAPFGGFDESVGYSVIGAVRLAIRQCNQTGCVPGHSTELVALDDGNDVDLAVQRARELALDPAVMAVLGGFDDATALAGAAEYAQAGLAFVAVQAPADTLTEQGYTQTLRLTGRSSQAGQAAAAWALRTLGARRFALLSEETAYPDALVQSFAAGVQGDGSIVYRGAVRRWQVDFADTVQGIAAAAPDLVFFGGRAAEGGVLLRQLRAAGVAATFLGGPAVDDPRLLQIGGGAQGAAYVSLWLPVGQVGDTALREGLASNSLRPPGPGTVAAYDGAQLVLAALKSAGRGGQAPSRADVARALQALPDMQAAGGALDFDARGNRLAYPLAVYRLGDAYPGEVWP